MFGYALKTAVIKQPSRASDGWRIQAEAERGKLKQKAKETANPSDVLYTYDNLHFEGED